VVDPLWFLGVYAGLTALTPVASWLATRFGAWASAFPALVVAAVDLVRFGFHGPAWVGWVNLPAGWLVPYLLGVAWARGALQGRRGPALMLAAGGAATAALIALAGYPASMVGVNGAAISNLNPPTIAAVTFGLAQCGLALLMRDLLARWMRRPLAWAAVATVNLSAMTLFLWHQTAFIMVTSLGMLAGHVPGLLTAPTSAAWVAERLAWLPAFAAVLAGLWLMFRGLEHARSHARPFPSGKPEGLVHADKASEGSPEPSHRSVAVLLGAGIRPRQHCLLRTARWKRPSGEQRGHRVAVTAIDDSGDAPRTPRRPGGPFPGQRAPLGI